MIGYGESNDRKSVFRVARFTPAAIRARIELFRMCIGMAFLALAIFSNMKAEFTAGIARFRILCMALNALQCSVFPYQGKPRQSMIELRPLNLKKTVRCVTLGTCLLEFSLMRVSMTRLTGGKPHLHIPDRLSILECILMALSAFDFFMFPGELKFCVRMRKF